MRGCQPLANAVADSHAPIRRNHNSKNEDINMDEIFKTEAWTLFSSISTTIAAIIAAVAAIIAIKQLREMAKTRHLEAMLRVYEMIGNESAREDRRFIFNNLSSPPELITDEERNRIERVSVTLDRVGKLIKSGLVPKEEFLNSHYEMVVRCWKVLEPYILHHENKVGGRHSSHFKYLYNVADKYHNRHFPNTEIRIVKLKEPENKKDTS